MLRSTVAYQPYYRWVLLLMGIVGLVMGVKDYILISNDNSIQ